MHPRDQLVLVIDRIYKRGLTTNSGGVFSQITNNGSTLGGMVPINDEQVEALRKKFLS